jgi:hypothetical protein
MVPMQLEMGTAEVEAATVVVESRQLMCCELTSTVMSEPNWHLHSACCILLFIMLAIVALGHCCRTLVIHSERLVTKPTDCSPMVFRLVVTQLQTVDAALVAAPTMAPDVISTR